MKKIGLLPGLVGLSLVAGGAAAAQPSGQPKACKATVGPEGGPFANAIVLILPDGKILPYEMMYRAQAGHVQIDPRRHELASRGDSAELLLVYGLQPAQSGIDVQLEEMRLEAPTVFGPGPLPGDKLREIVTQLTVAIGSTKTTVALEPDYAQPIDRGLITAAHAKQGKGVAIVDPEAQIGFARALDSVSSVHLIGERVGSSASSSLQYYAGDVPIGDEPERGAKLQHAVREAVALATSHPEQCH